MQTALHIAALVAELKQEILGGTIASSEFYKKERVAYFFIKRKRTISALAFVYHPAGSGCFLVPASKVRIKTREKPWPIFGLEGGEVTGIAQCGLDRIFRVTVSSEGHLRTVLFEAIGPNGNLWLLDENDHIQATLRKKKHNPGERYAPPELPAGRLNPLELTEDALKAGLAALDTTMSIATFIERRITGFNRTMAREIARQSDMDRVQCDKIDADRREAVVRAVRSMADRFLEVGTGYLYSVRNMIEAYPFKLKAVDSQPEKHKTLSLAIQEMVSRRQSQIEEMDEQKIVTAAVDRAIKRLRRRLKNLESDVAAAADYDTNRKYAELLQINRAQLKKGMPNILVDDVYSESGDKVDIPLNPSLSPSDNIDDYFKKYRKGREGLDLLMRRQEISRGELTQLELMRADLEADFEFAQERYRSDIESLMPRVGEKQQVQPRLPYKEHILSTGLKIYVGREGADNDRTTFEFAKPFELWFHTQQCPGSHVVMKYPNKSFEPSKAEIEETAAIAAYHSKARNDSMVPVVYTKRRYVRKPRKAKPGLVMVEREKSVMVIPKKPE